MLGLAGPQKCRNRNCVVGGASGSRRRGHCRAPHVHMSAGLWTGNGNCCLPAWSVARFLVLRGRPTSRIRIQPSPIVPLALRRLPGGAGVSSRALQYQRYRRTNDSRFSSHGRYYRRSRRRTRHRPCPPPFAPRSQHVARLASRHQLLLVTLLIAVDYRFFLLPRLPRELPSPKSLARKQRTLPQETRQDPNGRVDRHGTTSPVPLTCPAIAVAFRRYSPRSPLCKTTTPSIPNNVFLLCSSTRVFNNVLLTFVATAGEPSCPLPLLPSARRCRLPSPRVGADASSPSL
jgi:hypothetical protein